MGIEQNVPQVRFKGFTDAWEQHKLFDLLTQRIQHQTISEDAPLLAFSYAEGVINPEDKKTNKRDFLMTDKDNKVFSLTEKDDIIYNPANIIHGAIHRNKLGRGVVSPIYKIFICNNVSPKFMGERLHTDDFIKRASKYIEGTVIKLRTLSPETFLDMNLTIPTSNKEQEKIGLLLEKIEDIIERYQNKYTTLQRLKKSMLQKMFPKKGSMYPEIRFAGFTDAWEQRKLGDIGENYTGLSGKTKEDFGHGNAKFVTYMNVFSNSIADSSMTESVEIDKKQNEVKYGDVFFTTSSETPDEVGMSSVWLENGENTYLNSFCFGYRPSVKINSYYMAYMLRSDNVRKNIVFLAQGISRYNISKNKMMEISVPLPNLEEQQKIGEYFRNLDNLITLHQQKLETLKKIKKAMLQKMFV